MDKTDNGIMNERMASYYGAKSEADTQAEAERINKTPGMLFSLPRQESEAEAHERKVWELCIALAPAIIDPKLDKGWDWVLEIAEYCASRYEKEAAKRAEGKK